MDDMELRNHLIGIQQRQDIQIKQQQKIIDLLLEDELEEETEETQQSTKEEGEKQNVRTKPINE